MATEKKGKKEEQVEEKVTKRKGGRKKDENRRNITKKDFAKKIAEENGQTAASMVAFLQSTLDLLVKELASGSRLEFRGFGVFDTKLRKGRKARNPKTGGSVSVPVKRVVTFKSGKDMKALIGGKTETFPWEEE